MKKLILSLLFVAFISTAQTQILLDEANVEYTPVSMKLDPGTNSLVLKLKEKRAGEFHANPLVFMKKNFNSQKFIEENKDAGFESYTVKFKSRKGHLTAQFDNKGALVSSYQNFKNVVIPSDARSQIVKKYRNCSFLKSSYAASSKGWDITKEQYKIKIKDGNKIHRIKINKDADGLSLAGM